MSNVASPGPSSPPELATLEQAVRGLLDEYARLSGQAIAAEGRIAELEAALVQLRGGGPDPLALASRVQQLEAENRALDARLQDAAERVRRLIARTSFLEEER